MIELTLYQPSAEMPVGEKTITVNPDNICSMVTILNGGLGGTEVSFNSFPIWVLESKKDILEIIEDSKPRTTPYYDKRGDSIG